VWSPSLVVIERTGTTCCIILANFGRCSEIFTPGTAVSIGLIGPPFLCPGFKSNVSIWLGPPVIQSSMQARFRFGSLAVPSANALSQPDCE